MRELSIDFTPLCILPQFGKNLIRMSAVYSIQGGTINSIVKWLSRPYPIAENFQQQCTLSLVLGMVVSAVLLLFQPFEIHSMESIRLLSVGGFGMVTTLSLFGLFLLVSKVSFFGYEDQKWSVGRQILFLTVLLLIISLGNWWLNNSIAEVVETVRYTLFQFVGITTFVGIVPLLVSIFFSERLLRTRNMHTAETISLDIHHESTTKGPLPIAAVHFLYAKAEGNYIQIFSTNKQPELLRCTMKDLENLYADEGKIVRCHRSFMVNASSVITVQGNAGGLTLRLSTGEEIPVSRSYVPVIKTSIASNVK